MSAGTLRRLERAGARAQSRRVLKTPLSHRHGTQHYAVSDYDDQPRLLHRITVAGDIPVGPDDRPSVARRGDASQYSVIAEPLAVS